MRHFNHPLGLAVVALALVTLGCDNAPSSDVIQQQQQERILMEGTAQLNMPAIKNFREKKLYKDILEMRDRNITTYTYLFCTGTGKFTYLGETIGFGIPYATQYTNPQKIAHNGTNGVAVLAQADPNGLFSPSNAEGTWILLKDPNSDKVSAAYLESRITVSPFKLPARVVAP